MTIKFSLNYAKLVIKANVGNSKLNSARKLCPVTVEPDLVRWTI